MAEKKVTTQVVKAALIAAGMRYCADSWSYGGTEWVSAQSCKENDYVLVRCGAGDKQLPGDADRVMIKAYHTLRNAGFNAQIVFTEGNGVVYLQVMMTERVPLCTVTPEFILYRTRERRIAEINNRIEANTLAMNKAQEPFAREHARLQRLLAAMEE